MRRSVRLDAMLVVGSAAAAGVLAVHDGVGFIDWVFGTVLFSGFAVVCRLGVTAALAARRESARALSLTRTKPGDVAVAAVHEERRRLLVDTLVVVRGCLRAVLTEVERIDVGDPGPTLRRVHEQTQLATSELRRQLGLLRTDPRSEDPPDGPAAVTRVTRTDVVIAVALVALAIVEGATYLEALGSTATSAILAALGTAPVVLRRAAPGVGCLLVALVNFLSIVIDAPIVPYLSTAATLVVLLWTVVSRGSSPARDVLSAVAMVAMCLLSTWLSDTGNLAMVSVILTGAACGGLAVRMARRRQLGSHAAARRREQELQMAARAAVTAERAGFARDLHDVVSHAVGLIAVQAAAGQVSWPRQPDEVARSVSVVRDTARSTLAELDLLVPAPWTDARTVADLTSLVDRVRRAGTPVDLTMTGTVPDALLPTVHRVIQEALTNVVRHAPGSAATVTITASAEGVELRVIDLGAPMPATGGRGYGLVGLAERLEFLGGTLMTGPRAGGGFAVTAWMPAKAVVRP